MTRTEAAWGAFVAATAAVLVGVAVGDFLAALATAAAAVWFLLGVDELPRSPRDRGRIR